MMVDLSVGGEGVSRKGSYFDGERNDECTGIQGRNGSRRR